MIKLSIEPEQFRTRIVIRPGVLSEIGDHLRSAIDPTSTSFVVLISDKTVGALYGSAVKSSLANAGGELHEHRIEPGERSKSLGKLDEVYRMLLDCGADRNSVVVALGGGVVSDLAGFAAATWMRGVRWAICPTTLEADLDASIGGKTGINLPGGKNLAGAFHHPFLVLIDPLCLRTLDERDIRAGLAESVKHALITAPEFLTWHEQNLDAVMRLDSAVMTELIVRNVRIKSDVVVGDAYERSGGRMVLNFGHTIGHAIEACSEYTLRHGECVALGMVAACRISNALGLLGGADTDRVGRLLQRVGLPIALPMGIDTDRIIETIGHDKKVRGGRVRFVLLEEIGKPVVRDDVPASVVRNAIESLRL